MRVVLIGAPGSGKGTQGPLLAAVLGVAYLGLGDLMRAEVLAGTERGELLKGYMAAGRLAPDELATAIVQQVLRDHTAGFVLDGYPRTLAQAEILDLFLSRQAADIDAVVVFSVADEVLLSRLAARGRADDEVDVARARLAIYADGVRDIGVFYRERIVELDAEGHVDEVHQRLIDGLRERVISSG